MRERVPSTTIFGVLFYFWSQTTDPDDFAPEVPPTTRGRGVSGRLFSCRGIIIFIRSKSQNGTKVGKFVFLCVRGFMVRRPSFLWHCGTKVTPPTLGKGAFWALHKLVVLLTGVALKCTRRGSEVSFI